MNASTEDSQTEGRFDPLIWLVVSLLVGGGVFGNWYFGAESALYRAVALVAVAIAAVFLAMQTARGRTVANLMRESRAEIRRVVFPDMDETRKTTLFVVAMMVVVALILWVLDLMLSWIVRSVIG